MQAARDAIARYGVGPAAVRTIAGTMDLHLELERRLAAFKGVESSITFQSGFNANLATIPALVGKEDVIFSDELNHASIIDGIRLCKAGRFRYRNSDMGDLEEKLKETSGARFRLIATDGVFSMDGSRAQGSRNQADPTGELAHPAHVHEQERSREHGWHDLHERIRVREMQDADPHHRCREQPACRDRIRAEAYLASLFADDVAG